MKRKINISQSTFSRPDDWKCASRATSNESINWLEFKRNYHFLSHSICFHAGWRRYGCWELKLFQSFGMQVYCHWHNFLSLLNKQQKKSFSSTASDWNNLSERFDWVFRLIGIIFKYSDCTFFLLIFNQLFKCSECAGHLFSSNMLKIASKSSGRKSFIWRHRIYNKFTFNRFFLLILHTRRQHD